jgi:hypothetical protein
MLHKDVAQKVRYVNFRSTRSFGIELEVNEKVNAKELANAIKKVDEKHAIVQSNNYQQDYSNTYWHVKFDRSCGDVKGRGGWEVASYKAAGFEDINNIGRVTKALKECGAKVNDNCGYHIHVEIKDFTINCAATLVAYWVKIEPVICEMLPKHRRNNPYCRLLGNGFYDKKIYDTKLFWDTIKPRRFDNNDRRVSLNMCNYLQDMPQRKTVELRMPECNLDSKDVKNWIRFFVNFVDVVKNKPFPADLSSCNVYDVMKIAGFHSDNPFYILSKGMRETKIWFMRRLLEFSSNKKIREEAVKFLNGLEVKPKIRLAEVECVKKSPWIF